MKDDLSSMDLGMVVKNLNIMLRNMSNDAMKKSSSVRHYVGMNYELHLERLKDDYHFDTAHYYATQWKHVTGYDLPNKHDTKKQRV